MKKLDLTGQVYGRLTVLSRAESSNGQTRYCCICTCGISRIVHTSALRNGLSRSCGCIRLEATQTQSGGSNNDAYSSWKAMVQRCTVPSNTSYKRYGGAGTTVCAEWLSDFQAFLSHVGPKPTDSHSIDRVDNARGYEPGNVRWATRIEQSANRKSTAMVEYQGVVQPLALLARSHGLPPQKVQQRVFRLGWSVEKALGLST